MSTGMNHIKHTAGRSLTEEELSCLRQDIKLRQDAINFFSSKSKE